MKVVAGGGGSAEDEFDVLGHFCSTLGRNARVFNIPWAQADPAVPKLAEWARSALSVHGVARVDTAASLSFPSARLDAYDGLFLGGGNTYLLLDRLRSSGLAKLLIAAAREGMPCYGGSAGAIVLGAHIGTCAHLDRDNVGTSDMHGLDLFGGFAVWCHFRESDDGKARTFARESRLQVLAIPENAGVAFDGVTLTAIGPGLARLWTAGGPSPTGPQLRTPIVDDDEARVAVVGGNRGSVHGQSLRSSGVEGKRHSCPCCGYLTLHERGADEICPVCFWQDDGQDEAELDVVRGGPNGALSLAEARANFAAYRACEGRFVQNVRVPNDDEVPRAV